MSSIGDVRQPLDDNFFFNSPATTEIYTLSLHDALPISQPAAVSSTASRTAAERRRGGAGDRRALSPFLRSPAPPRSEEHTSELQSRRDLVCRLLLEKKKKTK